ncbi:MAG: family 16 glycosylhydrolase [Saprospiraceae bacterium]
MNTKFIIQFTILSFIGLISCEKSAEETEVPVVVEKIFPLTDAANTAKWSLKENLSDEFDGTAINESKWLVQGTNGVYQSNSYGRAPSQYSTKNASVKDGKLIVSVKWEPEFPFLTTLDKFGVKYENYTSSAVICKSDFLYGYMETRAKVADASVSSSFWATGSGSELDIFEHFGKPSIRSEAKIKLETEMWSSIHDWSAAGQGKSVWTNKSQLPFRVADDFHVYGCEWDKDFLKFYADGKLIKEVTRLEAGDGWVVVNPLKLWVNSVTWSWHGLPVQSDLPSSFQIDYIRVWQK